MNANKREARVVTEPLSYRRATRFHKSVKMAALLLPLLLVIAQARAQSALDGFGLSPNSTVTVVVVQPDGRILIGGDFDVLFSGTPVTHHHIARLNPDGTIDLSFNPNPKGGVSSIAVQADGKILVGGGFTSIGGQSRDGIARLDATTGLADSLNPNPMNSDGPVFIQSIAVQVDGRILAAGNFTSIGGQMRHFIARLDPTTGQADSFDPTPNNSFVDSIAVQPDGKILASGLFNNIGGQVRHYFARLDGTTGLADSFDPRSDGIPYSIAVQADGKILAAGDFGSIGGQTRNRIARLDPATGLADSFDPNPDNSVYAIAVQADGKILTGGIFTSIGGQPRIGCARLSNDTAALQNLAVTRTSITWTLGGAGPQFAHVTLSLQRIT